jgi:hypothetical protein
MFSCHIMSHYVTHQFVLYGQIGTKEEGFFVTPLSHLCHSHTLSTLTLGIPKDSLEFQLERVGDCKDLNSQSILQTAKC